MIAIDVQNIIRTRTEQSFASSFAAYVSKEINPHHGIEGRVLKANEPIKQIRLAISPELDHSSLYISEKALMELNGENTIKIEYRGDYSTHKSDKIYVFTSNMDKIAEFDVVISDDVRIYLRG